MDDPCALVSQRTARGVKILQKAGAGGAITMLPLPKELTSKQIVNIMGKKTGA